MDLKKLKLLGATKIVYRVNGNDLYTGLLFFNNKVINDKGEEIKGISRIGSSQLLTFYEDRMEVLECYKDKADVIYCKQEKLLGDELRRLGSLRASELIAETILELGDKKSQGKCGTLIDGNKNKVERYVNFQYDVYDDINVKDNTFNYLYGCVWSVIVNGKVESAERLYGEGDKFYNFLKYRKLVVNDKGEKIYALQDNERLKVISDEKSIGYILQIDNNSLIVKDVVGCEIKRCTLPEHAQGEPITKIFKRLAIKRIGSNIEIQYLRKGIMNID